MPAPATIWTSAKPTGGVLHALLARLLARRGAAVNDAGRRASAVALHLAVACLDAPGRRASAPNVVICGPTQVGKSTVVNLLLGGRFAGVSPKAGFTTQPQAVEVDAVGASVGTNGESGVGRAAWRPEGGATVWDTPDFDSLSASEYAAGLIQVLARADAVLLVVSKEKYADRAVWDWLDALLVLGRPLAIVANKVDDADREVVVRAIRSRLAAHGGSAREPGILPLPYDVDFAASPEAGGVHASALRDMVSGILPQALDPTARTRGVGGLIRLHVEDWLEPARAELEARRTFDRLVDAALACFVDDYQREYLHHPDRYDAFRRATLELLRLLELPGVGGAIARARETLTWPARRLLAGVQSYFSRHRPDVMSHSLGMEAGVLTEAWRSRRIALERDASRLAASGGSAGPWWRALTAALGGEAERLESEFDAALRAHHTQVEADIRQAATRLLDALSRDPARLNALRTVRAMTDVGAILLALKTGGLTPLDAVWAPTAFVVSSMLSEGVASVEFRRVDQHLRRQQLADVRERVGPGGLAAPLRWLLAALDDPALVGVDEAMMDASLRELAALERGDVVEGPTR